MRRIFLPRISLGADAQFAEAVEDGRAEVALVRGDAMDEGLCLIVRVLFRLGLALQVTAADPPAAARDGRGGRD